MDSKDAQGLTNEAELRRLAEDINSFKTSPGVRMRARVLTTWLVAVRDEEELDANYPVEARSAAEARAFVADTARVSRNHINDDWNHNLVSREILRVDPYRPLRDDRDPELILAPEPPPKPGYDTYDVIVHETIRYERIFKVEGAATAEEASALVLGSDPRAFEYSYAPNTVEILACEVKRVVGPMPKRARPAVRNRPLREEGTERRALRLPSPLNTAGDPGELGIGLALQGADMRRHKQVKVVAILEPREFEIGRPTLRRRPHLACS